MKDDGIGLPPALRPRVTATPLPPADERGLMVVVTAQVLPAAPRRSRLPVIIEQRPIVLPERRRQRRLLFLLPVLSMLPAAVLATFLWPKAPVSAPGSKVDIALPTGIEIDLPEPPVRARRATPKLAAARQQPVVAPSGKPPESKLIRIDRMPEVQASIRAALATGVAQSWSGDGIKGYAVAGPVQIDGEHVCRNLVIWAEGPGGKGDTLKRRKCLGEGNAWLDDNGVPAKPAEAPADG